MEVRKWNDTKDNMIVRKLYVTTTMNCCRESKEIYKPASKVDVFTEDQVAFTTTLEQWKKIKGEEVCDQLKDMADAECAALGTDSYLCNWQCNVTNAIQHIEVLKMTPEKTKAIAEFEDKLLEKEIDILKLEVEIQKKELELMKRQLLRIKEAE